MAKPTTPAPQYLTSETLDQWFTHHAPGSEAVSNAHERIRQAARDFAAVVDTFVPGGPDKTIALHKVRSAMNAANSAIAVNHPDNQKGTS
jgi:hypothetical protein